MICFNTLALLGFAHLDDIQILVHVLFGSFQNELVSGHN